MSNTHGVFLKTVYNLTILTPLHCCRLTLIDQFVFILLALSHAFITTPRTLAVHNVAALLPPGQSCYDYWSLRSHMNGSDQYLTDELTATTFANCTLSVDYSLYNAIKMEINVRTLV